MRLSTSLISPKAELEEELWSEGILGEPDFRCLSLEAPWIKFLDVGERSTLSTLNGGANEPLANNFVFQQIADETHGFPLACQLHLSGRYTENHR